MEHHLIIAGHSYNHSTIKSAMGNILSNKSLGGTKFKEEQISALTAEAVRLGLLEQEWVDARTKDKVSPTVSRTTYELIDDNSFDMAHTNDADLAALYLYKRKDAKQRGIDWTLSLSDLRNILKRKRCYYSGAEIVRDSKNKNRPTLDRIDNKKGYTKENTVMCAYWVNQLKNELFENPRSEFLTDMKTMLKILKNMQK